MAYSLVGNCYIGTGSLPTPVAGYTAQDTSTGNMYAANTSATAWNLIGNANETNIGLFPISGGNLTGAIGGSHGLATLDSPNFTTSAKLDGVDLATVNDLSSTETSILNSISPKITEAVASTSNAITVSANIARATGILTFTTSTPQTIPLPTYPDGTTASESDCKWFVGLVGDTVTLNGTAWPCGRSDSNGDTYLVQSANPLTTRTFAMYLIDKGGVIYRTNVAYFIEGIRS